GANFQIQYHEGTYAEGRVVFESVYVAGLRARHVAIGAATRSTVSPDDCDVIVGMASLMSPETSALRQPGLVPTMLAQGSIEHNLFAFGLWKDREARLDIGHIPAEYLDRISWTPVTHPQLGMWTVRFTISGVDGVQIGVVDTGSRMIVGPYRRVRRMFIHADMEMREENGRVFGQYHELGSQPYFVINIAGLNVVLNGDSLAYGTFEDLTVAGIVGQQNLGNWWLLGAPFLQNVYAVFNGNLRMVGFAPL
ncbi:hypothetical protein V8E36_003056, partial [Tilletia maclaganii]